MIIGDVHGCIHELQSLLEKCAVDENTSIVLVGDLVNKGPCSQEVVSFVRKIGAHCVRGNHDDAALTEFYNNGASSSKYAYLKSFTQ